MISGFNGSSARSDRVYSFDAPSSSEPQSFLEMSSGLMKKVEIELNFELTIIY